MELELQIPPAELVDVDKLRVDHENPNRMSARQFKALKKSIQRWGFIVPIITNKSYLVADGEHRLRAAKDMGMRQVSVVRLPVDDVDRRLIRQVMNMHARIPIPLKKLIGKYISLDTHINESDFIRDALREKIQKDAPELYHGIFKGLEASDKLENRSALKSQSSQ